MASTWCKHVSCLYRYCRGIITMSYPVGLGTPDILILVIYVLPSVLSTAGKSKSCWVICDIKICCHFHDDQTSKRHSTALTSMTLHLSR